MHKTKDFNLKTCCFYSKYELDFNSLYFLKRFLTSFIFKSKMNTFATLQNKQELLKYE